MNRRLEILIGSLLVLAIIAFIGMNIFKTLVDEDIVIEKISDAIFNLDVDYLKDHMEIEGVTEPLTAEQITNIATLLKDNGYNTYSLKNSYGAFTENIYLKKQGKENLIFDKYILVLRPYNITIESNLPSSIVYLNNIEYGAIDSESGVLKLDGIIPGKHKVKVVYEGEYVTLEREEELFCFDNDVYHNIYLEGSYVDIYANFPEAKLYINDKKTDVEIGNGYTLGPVPLDGTLEIQAKVEIDGEIYSSEKFVLDGYYSFYDLYIDYVEPDIFELPADEMMVGKSNIDGYVDASNAIYELMYQYQFNLVEAINFGDYSLVSPYIEENSPLMKSQVSLVNRLYNNGTKEELLGYEIVDIVQISDAIFEVQVYEHHKIYYSSGKEDEVINEYIYTAVLIDNVVYLRDIRR